MCNDAWGYSDVDYVEPQYEPRFGVVYRTQQWIVIGGADTITEAMAIAEIHASQSLRWGLGGERHRIYSDSIGRTNYHIQDNGA